MKLIELIKSVGKKNWMIILLVITLLCSGGFGWNENKKVRKIEEKRIALDKAYRQILMDLNECQECQEISDSRIAKYKEDISKLESDQTNLIKKQKYELKKYTDYISSLGDDDLIRIFSEVFNGGKVGD